MNPTSVKAIQMMSLQERMMNEECVDFGRTADRIYINVKTSVTLSANGGGMGAKTGLYLLPRHIQHQPIGQGENTTESGGGYRSK